MSEANNAAIVTGGGSGIGRAVALALAGAGWRVVVAGRRLEALEETAAAAAGEVVPIVADVTDAASVDQLFDGAVGRLGRVDLLFNNAGINAPTKPLDELEAADIKAVLDVNIFGSMLCARAAFRVMRAQAPQGGRIINNGSVSAYGPRPRQATYTASKHAITGLTKALILDGRDAGIAVGQIDIGNAATEMSTYMTSGAMQADGSMKPEPRIPAARIAEMVVHMAGLPLEANIPFMTVMATKMPLYGRG